MKNFSSLVPLLFSIFVGATPLGAQDRFGAAVAVQGDTLLVLKPNAGIGYAGLYQYVLNSDGTWQNSAKLRPTGDGNSGEGFSASMALLGSTLLVGSGDPDVRFGAHVFLLGGNSGVQPRIPFAAVAEEVERTTFDFAALRRIMRPPPRVVAFDGNRAAMVAVGATGSVGAVLIVAPDSTTAWLEVARIEAPDTSASRFGAALAFVGENLFVGAPGYGDAGAVFVYAADASSQDWTQRSVLVPADLEPGSQFGKSILADGATVLIGAPGSTTTGGVVVVYAGEVGASNWNEVQRLLPAEGMADDRFGWSLSSWENELWVGAPGHDSQRGLIRRFDREATDGTWREIGSIGPAELGDGFRFGQALAISANTAVAGAPGADRSIGWAAAFTRPEGGDWSAAEWLKVTTGFEVIAEGAKVECVDGEAAQFSCRGVDLLSFLTISFMGGSRTEGLSDLWGWTDPDTGREYALVGRTNGTAFVDITNPSSPVYLGVLPSNASGTRDIKVYENFVFVTGGNAGDHGMLIMDLTRLRNLTGVPVTFEPDTVYTEISSAHNLIINTQSGFAFVVGATGGGQTCGGGLHMVDIREPLAPVFAGCYTDTEGLIWQGRTHDAQCIIYTGPDNNFRDREICFASNETAIRIVDVTDKENPIPISVSTYPGISYVHQGWLTEDQRYFFQNDELDELIGQAELTRTLVWDVSELDDPILVGEYYGPNSATDHNLYIKGDRMYQANYQAGLRIIDISDPENPAEVGFFDTTPYDGDPTGFNGGAWTAFPFFESGTVIVSSSREGLFVLRARSQELLP